MHYHRAGTRLDNLTAENGFHPDERGDKFIQRMIHDRFGGTGLDDLSIFHDRHPVGQAQGLKTVVGGHHRRRPGFLQNPLEVVDQAFPGRRIEGREGLIQEDDFRMNGEGPGQACPLRLSPG